MSARPILAWPILTLAASAWLGGCVAPETHDIEPAASPPSVIGTTPEPPPPAPRPKSAGQFPPLNQEGLVFRFESISASVQLYASNRKGRPQVRRDLTLSGTVKDPLGRRLFRIADVELESVTDGQGADVLAGAEIEENPQDSYDGWENVRYNRGPGSPTAQPFSFRAGDLDSLPSRLGSVRGHVDVDLVSDMKSIEIVAEESDTFVRPLPGVAYRVTRWSSERDRLRFQIEYTLERTGEPGADAPVFLWLDLRDDSGNPVHLGVRPLETVLGSTIQGTLQTEVGIGRLAPGPVRLLFATAMTPVRFDFDLRDIPLTESRQRP